MIVKKVVYNEVNDTLVGFYGRESLEHEYKQNFVIVIGERLIRILFQKIALFTMPTCNCFNNEMVMQQYELNYIIS